MSTRPGRSFGAICRGADELDAVGARPFRPTRHFTDFAAGTVDQKRRWHAKRLARGFQLLKHLGAVVGIVSKMRDADLLEKMQRLLRMAGIDIDRDDVELGAAEIGLEGIECRHLFAAGHAPRGPKVKKHGAAAPIGQGVVMAGAVLESQIGKAKGRARHCQSRDPSPCQRRNPARHLDRGRTLRGRRIASQPPNLVYPRQHGYDRDGATRHHGQQTPPILMRGVVSGLGHRTAISADLIMSNKMWGGRFGSKPHPLMEEINVSIDFDRHLYRQDIAASKAHVAMLAKTGIISAQDAKRIAHGLDTILSEIEAGKFKFRRALEDMHMNGESRLEELIGSAAGRLHTALSRNDQVATDFRLWVLDAIDDIEAALKDYQRALAEKALEHAATVIPGFTHLQTAQPVTFGHHLLAYVEMAARDRGRFADARKRLNESPLGAAALAGTSFPIDRAMTAKSLGFDRPMANSLDAVSDRDFVIETLSAAAITSVHLSRFAEEIVIWTSPLVGLVRLSDKFTTGSSIMPQKRNPDAAELVRSKTGRIIGSLNAILIVMKGLPLAYAKDMQEDKEGAMDALSALSLSIAAMDGMIADMEPDAARMKKAAGEGYATATDLADWLVRTLKIPFREAHHLTGRIVGKASEAGQPLHRLPLSEMQAIEPRISEDVFTVLSVDRSVK